MDLDKYQMMLKTSDGYVRKSLMFFLLIVYVINFNFILCGQIRGYNSSISTIIYQDGSC